MTDPEGCLDCGRGLHKFCQECDCCNASIIVRDPKNEGSSTKRSSGNEKDLQGDSSTNGDSGSDSSKVRGRPIKNPGEIQDKHSTGRKRAALLYPIMSSDDPCEWRSLANCGGGKYPIIGCIDGTQQHRHHGPDKNTLRNEQGNVHRICDDCHNIWHSQNDKDYDPSIGHNPRSATHEELIDRAMKVRYYVEPKL